MNGKDIAVHVGVFACGIAACGTAWFFYEKRNQGSRNNERNPTSPTQPYQQNTDYDLEEDTGGDIGSRNNERNPTQQYQQNTDYDLEGAIGGDIGSEMIDAVILHADEDENEAKCCQQLLESQLKIYNPKIEIADNVLIPGESRLDGLGDLLVRCRLILVYHSRNTCMDGMMVFSTQVNLIQALEDPQKSQRIIPLRTDVTEISTDLSVIQPITYDGDINNDQCQNFLRKMEKLILHWRQCIPYMPK